MKENQKESKLQIITSATCSVIMLLCVVAYLVVGFALNLWHPTWMIIVSGVIVCGFITIIINAVTKVKESESTSLQALDDNKN